MNKTAISLSLLLIFSICLYILVSNKHKVDMNITVKSIDGRSYKLSDLVKKPTVLLFWSTSCTTCMKEMPDWIRQKADKNIEIISVAMSYDNEEELRNYSKKAGINFIVLHDKTSDISNLFNVKYTPAKFILNKNGDVKQY